MERGWKPKQVLNAVYLPVAEISRHFLFCLKPIKQIGIKGPRQDPAEVLTFPNKKKKKKFCLHLFSLDRLETMHYIGSLIQKMEIERQK